MEAKIELESGATTEHVDTYEDDGDPNDSIEEHCRDLPDRSLTWCVGGSACHDTARFVLMIREESGLPDGYALSLAEAEWLYRVLGSVLARRPWIPRKSSTKRGRKAAEVAR